MDTEWTGDSLKIALDPNLMNALWQGLLSWGWMIAGGLALLVTVVRMMGFRIKKARTYMKEHPGILGKAVFGVTVASIALGSAAFGVSTWHKTSEAAIDNDLPGAWRVLYEQLDEFAEHETRMLALSVFTNNAGDELPPLPFTGLARFLSLEDGNFSGAEAMASFKELLEKFVEIK